MRAMFTGAALAIAVMITPVAAAAQERSGDAALGALSGAIVLGPVGAVAGAVVGYTMGPSIARAWGLKGRKRHPRTRPASAKAHSKMVAARPPTPAAREVSPRAATQPAGARPQNPPVPRSPDPMPAPQTLE